jgi:DNA polymerase V
MKSEEKASDNHPLFDSSVQAGFPTMLTDDEGDRLNINDYLISNKTATYFIRVKGDSMEGAGIFDKDILIVDRSKPASSGKIIIAYLNGAFTVKRLMIQNKKTYLYPENPNYKPIRITDECEFELFGVVTYNIHKPL